MASNHRVGLSGCLLCVCRGFGTDLGTMYGLADTGCRCDRGTVVLDNWNDVENGMTKYDVCPRCNGHLGDMWRRGRKLRQECQACDWVGKERVPEQKAIVPTRRVPAGMGIGGHTFQVFDRYGHTSMSSRGYPSADATRVALKRELTVGSAGPYTGILWPSTVMVEGEIIR